MAVAFTPALEPSVSSGSESTPIVIESEFGDGYSQRASGGIAPVRRTARLTWSGIESAAAATLEADLNAGAGVVARSYALPYDGTTRLWVVKKVSVTWSGRLLADVSAELREVFDL